MRGMEDLPDAAIAWLAFCDTRREFLVHVRIWLASRPAPADATREIASTKAMLASVLDLAGGR
jgi:hypothetical protein